MLKQDLIEAQITTLKSKNTKHLETLRYILSQIKNKEIEKQGELTDEETILVLRKIAKNLKKGIEMFEKGGRGDLIEQYKKQLEIVFRYLPAKED